MTPQELNALYAQKKGGGSATSSPAAQPQQNDAFQQALKAAQANKEARLASQPAEQPQQGLASRAFNAITGSEQAFGRTLGGALATSNVANKIADVIPGMGQLGGGVTQQISQEAGQDVEQHNATLQAIQKARAEGRTEEANRLAQGMAQRNLGGVQAPTLETIIPESQKSARQIFGEGAGVVADIASAGLFGKGANAARTGQLLTGSEKVAGLASRAGVPFTGVTQAVKAPLLQRAGALAKEGAALGGLYGGSQQAQQNASAMDIFKGAAGGAVLGGGISGALPITGAALSKVGQGGAKFTTEFLGKATGSKGAAIKEIFNNPDAIEFARRAGKNPEVVQKEVVDTVVQGLKAVKDKRATKYQQDLAKLNLDPQVTVGALQNVKGRMSEIASNAGGFYSPADNVVNLGKSTIIDGRNVVQQAFDDVAGWSDTSPTGLDTLKRRLDSYVGQLRSPDKKEAQRVVLQLKDSVRNELETKIPGYKEMTKAYAEASDFIDELEKTFALKRGRTEEQQLNKIMQMFRPGKERSMEMAREVQEILGEDIVGKAAGASMGELMPKGLAGVVSPQGLLIGGAALGMGNVPGIIAYLMTTSPRLVAEVVSLLGRFPAAAVKQKVFPQALQDAIRRILIKAGGENL